VYGGLGETKRLRDIVDTTNWQIDEHALVRLQAITFLKSRQN
jgi:hypothetical protein